VGSRYKLFVTFFFFFGFITVHCERKEKVTDGTGEGDMGQSTRKMSKT